MEMGYVLQSVLNRESRLAERDVSNVKYQFSRKTIQLHKITFLHSGNPFLSVV
jgi:hypothetical protein